MTPLIKRDFRSLRPIAIIMIPLLVLFAIFLFSSARNANEFRADTLIFFIFGFVLFFSYGMLSQVCRTEAWNGVQHRVRQLPFSFTKIVLSRYITSFLLISILSSILFLSYGIGRWTTGGFFVSSEIFFMSLVILSVIFVAHALYLFFYFSYGPTVASWSIRISTVFLLVSFLFSTVYMNHETQIYPERLCVFLFIASLLFYCGSFIISRFCYEHIYEMKRVIKATLLFLLFGVICLFFVYFFSLVPASQQIHSVEEYVESISVVSTELKWKQERVIEITIELEAPSWSFYKGFNHFNPITLYIGDEEMRQTDAVESVNDFGSTLILTYDIRVHNEMELRESELPPDLQLTFYRHGVEPLRIIPIE
ncbi:ABC-2 transporter permease [Alkalihalobacterium bogoriense]|uniref:ABC-2 transporter permease n=1 Tax=Alkalihalobacterium bogoriense TaxID=246272 RepID=UPI00047B0DE6|nr:ABC-2 transporter permease [Alkalihalobacterium bogoriense]